MDFRNLAVQETSVLHLRSATDEPMVDEQGNPYTITVYGPGSKQWVQANAAQTARLLQKVKGGRPAEFSAEERTANQIEMLVACTKEFSPNIEYDGQAGPALFRAVYSDQKIGFIAEQVSKHISDWGNFSTPSTAKPASTSDKPHG